MYSYQTYRTTTYLMLCLSMAFGNLSEKEKEKEKIRLQRASANDRLPYHGQNTT